MPGLKKNRKRPNTIAFHVSDNEKVAIETRINLYWIMFREKIGCDWWEIRFESTECSVRKHECVFA
jgi:hypothetical protein